MGNKNICFVSSQAYPILAQTMHQSIGGAEVQQVLIAKELEKYQFNISFVAGDYGQKTIEEIDGMRIIESFKEFYGNRKLRFLPDMIFLFRALRIPDADIYYLRCPIFLLGQVALFCKEYKRKLIFSVTKDPDAQRDHIASFKYVWSRCGCTTFAGIFIRSGKVLFDPFKFDKGIKSLSEQNNKIGLRQQYLKNRFIRFFWTFIILIELTVIYNLKVRIPLLFGKVVICDRYLLDTLVEMGVYTKNENIHRRFSSILLRLLNPSPDISFLISISPRVVLERKSDEFLEAHLNKQRFLSPSPSRAFLLDTWPEIIIDRNHENIPKAHLEKQILLYYRIAKEYDVTIIDADQFEDINKNLVHDILTDYYANFRALAKGLLLANPNQLNPRRKQ